MPAAARISDSHRCPAHGGGDVNTVTPMAAYTAEVQPVPIDLEASGFVGQHGDAQGRE